MNPITATKLTQSFPEEVEFLLPPKIYFEEPYTENPYPDLVSAPGEYRICMNWFRLPL